MTELEKAAVEAFKQLGNTSFLEIFKAGANWQKEQFEKIENYQVKGWYSNSRDEEYIYGISFEEPIKLPVEFYVKKK